MFSTKFVDRDLVLWKYLTASPMFEPRHGEDELGSYLFDEREQRVLSKATTAAGGFLVSSDFDDQITSARRARNVIAELARTIETTHGRALPLPTTTAHGSTTWTAENAAVTASDETFAQVSLNAYKSSTKTIASQELVTDAEFPLDQYLGEELGQRTALLEETAFAVGDGTGKPLGITTAGNGVATVTAATGSATGFKLADVRSVWAALPDSYKPDASWLMSPSALASLANLTDTAGALVLPSLHAGTPTLYGAPVYSAPELPAAAANARSVVVGDVSLGYAVRRVKGLGIKRQEELHSDNDQVGYLLFSRVDGRVVLADALRILVHSAT
ncbi:MAG: phage major capsid protein [Actinobacteria bacterium]|nr:phage major capsid protein [Actinomycetota bacterium]